MPRNRLSENVNLAIGFISGVIFSNAIGALIQGQLVVALLSLAAVALSIFMKRFIDWGVEE